LNSHPANADFCEALRQCLCGRVCFMGLGNTDYGDDGFGVRLAEELADAGLQNVIIARTSPERYMAAIHRQAFKTVIFIDGVEFGGRSGSVVLLDADEIAARFPQISTHKMSLAVIAKLLASDGVRAFLLGVEPESVKLGQPLTYAVRTTLLLLKEILLELAREFRDLDERDDSQPKSSDNSLPRERPLYASEVIA
jgi:hydrogenase maturation protease